MPISTNRVRISWLVLLLVLAVAVAVAVGSGISQPSPARAASLVVNDAGDAGDGTCDATCTFRDAIIAANADAGSHDTITFDLGAGTHTIAPLTDLPFITSPLSINGFCETCSGATANTAAAWAPTNAVYRIILSGTNRAPDGIGLTAVTGAELEVRGLVISGWLRGILVTDNATAVIAGNQVGTNADGTAAEANLAGVLVRESLDAVIGGPNPADRNIISGNTNENIHVCSNQSVNVEVYGNFIGTNAAGTAPLSPTATGIRFCNNMGHTVGGDSPGEGNLISGNLNGISLNNTENVNIEGNRIGTNANGDAAVPNSLYGIVITQGSMDIDIGGSTVAHRNIISGNGYGLTAASSSNIDLVNNCIGTDALCNSPASNQFAAISVNNLTNVLVQQNIISGNTRDGPGVSWGITGDILTDVIIRQNFFGIAANGSGLSNDRNIQIGGALTNVQIGQPGMGNYFGASASHGLRLFNATGMAIIQGNVFGMNQDGDPRPNSGHGIDISSGFAVIGGTGPGEGNVITNNEQEGISVDGEASVVTILGNRIYGQGDTSSRAPIDLGADGQTENDDDDSDTGPNGLQNHPDIADVSSGPGGSQVEVTLTSTPNRAFTIEVFSAPECVGDGGTDAHTFIGRKTGATTAANGQLMTTIDGIAITPGSFITATATDEVTGATSELAYECGRFPPPRLPEDVNCSGAVDADDVIAVLRDLAGFSGGNLPAICHWDPVEPPGDADRDGNYDIGDAIYIRRHVAGLFPPD